MRNHSITKGQAMTMDQVRELAPAAFAEKPSAKVSERYGFVPTYQVIEEFIGNGFIVTHAHGGIRGASRSEGAHEIRLRSSDDRLRAGNYFSEIVFANSHDGTSPAVFNNGLYRVDCDNGLIVPAAQVHDMRRVHSKFSLRDVMLMAESAANQADRVEGVVGRWRNHRLNREEIARFIHDAEILAFGSARIGDALNTARRGADVGDDLWTVFNRVQENILRGGINYRTPRKRGAKSRPITSMLRTRKINLGLWRNAELILPA